MAALRMMHNAATKRTHWMHGCCANHQSHHLVDQVLNATQLWAYGVCQLVQGLGGWTTAGGAMYLNQVSLVMLTSCTFSGNSVEVSLCFCGVTVHAAELVHVMPVVTTKTIHQMHGCCV